MSALLEPKETHTLDVELSTSASQAHVGSMQDVAAKEELIGQFQLSGKSKSNNFIFSDASVHRDLKATHNNSV